jgi:glutathione-regulated potassium-efflux system ancillary protein KefG
MAKVLILFAHPAFEKSRVHASLVRAVRGLPDVTIHDLYEAYPDFDIDVKREQQLLLQHDMIIFQHPFYWYSSPAIIKQWLDLVLEHNWAYGSGGTALRGKIMLNSISCGGSREAYVTGGRNRFSIRQFLFPFDQTAALCGMRYWPPFVIHGTHRLQQTDIAALAVQYRNTVQALQRDEIDKEHWEQLEYLNEVTHTLELN